MDECAGAKGSRGGTYGTVWNQHADCLDAMVPLNRFFVEGQMNCQSPARGLPKVPKERQDSSGDWETLIYRGKNNLVPLTKENLDELHPRARKFFPDNDSDSD